MFSSIRSKQCVTSFQRAAVVCGLVLVAVCAIGFARAEDSTALSPEESLKKARMRGKYSMLLRQIKVPEDRKQFSDFNDFGFSDVKERSDFLELPSGFSVYVELPQF